MKLMKIVGNGGPPIVHILDPFHVVGQDGMYWTLCQLGFRIETVEALWKGDWWGFRNDIAGISTARSCNECKNMYLQMRDYDDIPLGEADV